MQEAKPTPPTGPANSRGQGVRASLSKRASIRQSFFETANATNKKVCFVGAGTWGTATARRVAMNIQDMNERDRAEGKPDILFQYQDKVPIWINTDSEIGGRKLTTIINTDHENAKYLPGIKLPHNLTASTDIVSTVTGADIIFFTIPHQYLPAMLKQCQGIVKPTCIGVSLTKVRFPLHILSCNPSNNDEFSYIVPSPLAIHYPRYHPPCRITP